MSNTLKTLTVYVLIALISVFGAFGAARQYAPDLYYGFAQGVKRIPFVEKVRLKDDKGGLVGWSLPLFLDQSIIDTTKEKWTAEDIKKRNSILIEKVLELFSLS